MTPRIQINKQNSFRTAAYFFFVFIVMSSCNPTKRLTESEYLLNRNVIVDKESGIDKSEIDAYIKQKPNKKIFGVVRFHLWMHNLVNKEKALARKKARDKKIDEKNIKRAEKSKKLKSKNRLTFREWLLYAGEAPVVMDTFMTKKSAEQIRLFLNNKGFFHNTVKDSAVFFKRKVNVHYIIQANKPYTIRNIDYSVDDELVRKYVFLDSSSSLIRRGNNYDVDVLQNERDRLTKMLRNKGFYNFSKEYVYFKADSNLNSNQVDLSIGIKKFAQRVSSTNDSIVETNHKKYYINNVYIQTDYSSSNREPLDTILFKNYIFVFNAPIKYHPRDIADALLIRKDDLYQLTKAEDTYKRLSELRSFKIINISFRENEAMENKLDCYIQLSPVLKQSFAVETEGTNTSGNLGISGNITYQNKNTFKGAELFELKLKGGIEAQKLLNEEDPENISKYIPFNTIQFGPEMSLNVPRPLFPFNLFEYPQIAAPKSTFKVGLNYQERPDYKRTITNLSYGITYKENIYKRHTIIPIEVNFVSVDPSPKFQDTLNKINNLLLLNSFSSHFTTSSRYVFVFNNQDLKEATSFSYLRISAESSGNILRGINDLLGSPKDTTNGRDSYEIFNIIYAQYLRLDVDYRFYKVTSPDEKVVFRTAFGVGKPLYNLRVLPFEKSFFAGGSNGIRAWRARSLGPGSYQSGSSSTYDQIGDAQIEGNIEYRFNMVKLLNGAFFLDAGNIWQRKPDPSRPNGDFKLDRFYKEFAIGTGFGVRLDFSFFILRLDLGIKLRDPMFDENERWVIGHIANRAWRANYEERYDERYSFMNLNLGIGYPF